MYLADLGADVIKVERPGGDEARGWGPPFVSGASAWFASANRNKRSITLDLRKPTAAGALNKLIGAADVFMESFNPGKLASLGIAPDLLRSRHPRLIYCALSGFGLHGPDCERPGYDLAAQARSGLMSVTGAAGGRPQRVSTALSDIVTGMCAALAICAAAVRQRETGEGDLIDVSLLDSDLALMAPRIAAFMADRVEPAPSGGTDSVLAVYQTFAARDRDIVIAIGNDDMWARFCVAIELPALAADHRLADNAGRRAHRPEILAAIAAQLQKRNARDWQRILADAGVPTSLVQSLSEVVKDPQVVARECLTPLSGAAAGVIGVRSPFRLASMMGVVKGHVPGPGADTAAVLAEVGFSSTEIAELIGYPDQQAESDRE
jgi:crotonobetainyl-CoA:carnitine CoA-transferase CaiB-like acyl-CoA transferase